MSMAALLLSCTDERDYRTVIPKDAVAIGRVDASQIPFIPVLDLPDRIDMDLQQPCYVFAIRVGANLCYGIVAQSTSQVQGDDYQWRTVDGQWLVATNDQLTLLMGPARGKEQDYVRREMLRYLRQEASASGMESPLYEAIDKQSSPAAIAIAPEALPTEFRRLAATQLGIASKKDAMLLATLSTAADTITAHLSIVNATPTVKARMQALDDTFFHPIDGSLLTFTPIDTKMFAVINLDGSHILKALRSNEAVRTALLMMNRVVDLDLILKSIRGDITLAVTDFKEGTNADAILTASLASKQFMQHSDYWVESAKHQSAYKLEALPMQRFAFAMNDIRLWFGQVNKTIYVTTTDSLSEMRGYRGNKYILHKQYDIKGLRFYATIDMQALPTGMSLTNAKRMDIEIPRTGELTLRLLTDNK